MLAALYYKKRESSGSHASSTDIPQESPHTLEAVHHSNISQQSPSVLEQVEVDISDVNMQGTPNVDLSKQISQSVISSTGDRTRLYVTSEDIFRNRDYFSPYQKSTSSLATAEHSGIQNVHVQDALRSFDNTPNTNFQKERARSPRIDNGNLEEPTVNYATSIKLLRFSTKETVLNANLIRDALEKTIGRDANPQEVFVPEALQGRRRLFFDSLFPSEDFLRDFNAQFSIPRLDANTSPAMLQNPKDCFGSSYRTVVHCLEEM